MDELLPALPPEMAAGPEDEEGMLVEFDMEESEVEELPDGSAIVKMELGGPDEN